MDSSIRRLSRGDFRHFFKWIQSIMRGRQRKSKKLCFHLKIFAIKNDFQNRMRDSLELFEQICNCVVFAKSSMILFFNKKDLFAEKILKTPITIVFKHYQGTKMTFVYFVYWCFQSYFLTILSKFNLKVCQKRNVRSSVQFVRSSVPVCTHRVTLVL